MTTLSPSLPDQQRRTTRQSVQFSSCSTLDRARSSAGRDLLLTSSKPCTDEADTSSDEEGGVFFGAHDALETQLVAKLSHDSPCSSCSASPARRSSTRVPRVKKRDSREFIRRKTLLLSAKENSERNEPGSSKGEKTWAGGFYEWRDEDESGVDWEASFSSTPMTFRQTSSHADGTPSRRAVVPAQSDLTLDFSAFRLSDTPLTSVSSSEVNEKEGAASLSGPRASEEDEVYVGDNGDSEAGDSDKENSAMPISPETDSSDDEDVGPMKGLVVTFGLDAMEAGGFLGDATEHESRWY